MQWVLSPVHSLATGHLFLSAVITLFYFLGMYHDSTYFAFGAPVVFLTHEIKDDWVFYLLLCVIFIHQLITNWIYEVVFPWIINTIQNQTSSTIPYSKVKCLMVINANALYTQLHLTFVVSGITAQVTFLVALIMADIMALTYVNWYYLRDKKYDEPTHESIDLELGLPYVKSSA